MDNIEVSILNFENRILADRKQLNDLIYEFNNQKTGSEVLNCKINYLRTEIDYMNSQLIILKAGLEDRYKDLQLPPQTAETPRNNVVSQHQVTETPQQNAIPRQQVTEAPPRDATFKFQPYIQNINNIQSKNAASGSKDLENMIGKSWMGIFASILIFISFILFATLLAPFITDTIKMAAMYIVSVMLTVFGLLKLRKHNNKLYLAISSCGIGAIYISLLLTNLYFKAVGDIALYVFILFWAVFVCYLSKWQDRIFQIIGQCGITIALLFGIILCVKTGDSLKLLLLGVFFVITAFIFYLSSYSREFHKNIINNVFNCINVFQLWLALCLMRYVGDSYIGAARPEVPVRGFASYTELISESDKGFITYTEITAAVVLLFVLFQSALFIAAKLREKNIDFGIFIVINTVLAMLLIGSITYRAETHDIRGIIFVAMAVALLAVAEKKLNGQDDDGKALIQSFAMLVFVPSVYMVTFLREYIGLSVVMIPIILLGYYKSDLVYKYASLFMALIYCFLGAEYPVVHFGLGTLFFAVLAVCMYVKKEQYSGKFKLYSYLAGFLFICVDLARVLNYVNAGYDISGTIWLAVIAITNLIAMKSGFVRNFQTKQTERPCIIATSIINAVLMILNLYAIKDADNEACRFILVMLAILIFMVNSKNLIKQYEGIWPGIYIGVKLTILIVTILRAYETANYVISISAFLFAIISIVLGFRFYVKSFRLYGLFLSMLSVAKLIVVDISYDNTLGHALSFFVCGILCFVISMIYHLIDKRLQPPVS